VDSLRRGSHRRIQVTCEFTLSPKCRGEWTVEERLVNETRARNGGKVICGFCSHALKFAGRGNPNCTYKSLDDSLFASVANDEQAYLLGWIASDGSIQPGTIALYIHRKDIDTVERLRDLVCKMLPIRRVRDLAGFTINSKRMAADVCSLLQIQPGKKDATVQFPELPSRALRWAFIRGYFDGDGCISAPNARGESFPYPRCDIASTSDRLLDAIADFCGIPASRYAGRIEWAGNNALDFLARIYDEASIYLPRKHDLYLEWATWVPGLGGKNSGRIDGFRWLRTLPGAIAPFKQRASDSGYDLTLVSKGDSRGIVQFFRTGLKIQPPYGWYFDLVPRSSILKTGYILANSVGVIDRGYVGEVLVPLIKVDPAVPELPLPSRIVQLIPRPIVHAEFREVQSLEATGRSGGGFGSTDA